MEQCRAIGDHEFANYGKRSIAFASSGDTYRVDVDDSDQNHIHVHHAGGELRWGVEVKDVCGGVFRLQGMTAGADDLLGGCFWYELNLTSPSTITYWGNRVVTRKDREV